MKYKRPFNPSHKPYHNRFHAPHKNNPQPYSAPQQQTTLENVPANKPNISKPNSTPEPQQILKLDKPKNCVS